ncbi:MAG: hypothetical protein M3R55_11810 [Acidobacteriota bacterium]|nr:hypothetical protein [Acidobacteriota bacterium]
MSIDSPCDWEGRRWGNDPQRPRPPLLATGGALSALLAVLHVAVIVIGPPAYRFFGAPDEFALQAESGSLVPALLTAIFAAIFGLWAAYGFAGARMIPRLPLIREGLALIAGVYILRGLSAIPEAVALLRTPGAFPPRFLVFSIMSLLIGVCYAAGTRQAWRRLRYRH